MILQAGESSANVRVLNGSALIRAEHYSRSLPKLLDALALDRQ